MAAILLCMRAMSSTAFSRDCGFKQPYDFVGASCNGRPVLVESNAVGGAHFILIIKGAVRAPQFAGACVPKVYGVSLCAPSYSCVTLHGPSKIAQSMLIRERRHDKNSALGMDPLRTCRWLTYTRFT